ncbi:hypothetical protein [Ornithinicoccus hortensis]|uniref:4-amino-4-deoxy-L-arabinose transferase-like glycosyltransferase n=1 Tax=Ornithinicoccus hortensis TaxID=82346 RepID=A0A542YU97_9MICO|nr:hypothetical protein [Ornithinicoccus hortensis]TQL51656.1 hypothetical protein FB467_2807 [Ornithinicoccus hortensis]
MSTTQVTGSDRPVAADPGDTHWLLRNPIRTGFLLILGISLAVRYNVLRDSYFLTDDFMLQSRAMESPLGWEYLTRVHTGHFEPIGFGFMWLLGHLAPWNWTVAMVSMLAAQALVAVLVWRMLVELFRRRALILVPFAFYCLTPLTMPAFSWLSAAIIWLPLTAALAGGVRSHARYLRTGRRADAAWAVGWYVVGLASFEKIAIYLPFIAVLTFALSPTSRATLRDLWALFRRTWLVWAGYLVASLAYLVVYLDGAARADSSADMIAPTQQQLGDFVYLSLFRTMIPGALGGPWSWYSEGAAGAIVNSPRAFDWACWIVALAVVAVSLSLRRRIGRTWLALLVYVAGSLATLTVGRLALLGPAAALETRYLADAVVPLVITVGMCLMPLRFEADPWLPQARLLVDAVTPTVLARAGVVAGTVWVVLALHSANGYAVYSAVKPHQQFVETTRTSLAELPEDAQIFDMHVPVNVLHPLFGDYDYVSRFLAPISTPEQREEMYTRESYTNPYLLTPEGTFVPMAVQGFPSREPLEGLCGWQPEDGRAAVPLTEEAYAWHWAVRVGFLSGGETTGTIVLGDARQEVTFPEGLGGVTVSMVGGGTEVVIEDLDPDVNICFGDAQVGNPVPDPNAPPPGDDG